MTFTASDIEDVPIMDTWRAMEALADTGKVRAIGVSNFNQAILEKMIPQCRIVPAVNQIELHPFNQQTKLVNFCKQHSITPTAYCPLGGSDLSVIEDPFFKRMAEAHMCTPSQAVLSWNLARGVVVIPKSTNPQRLKQNLHRITPTNDEMRLSAKCDKQERRCHPLPDVKELEWVFHEDKATCPLI
ncbi:Aldo/keto reductase [Linderina pennispora]|uniref:Aldo/keto reductase n=1 Tax=Linderina pennispora TaxID=61395 RepID=A0A1Y1W3N9_9FUNG|nr:Aldo/keto reductase [Linderina pennispora]ORX68169.1 Aldo/keto reductase [Linderina pennispora]